jgi:hypothetical protein
MARAIDWARYDRLKAQGRSERDIADALNIPRTTLRRELEKRATEPTTTHQGTRARRQRHTQPHPGTPPSQPTPVHPGVPMPNDLAGRLLALLPDLEAVVARERDRQRLLSTPIGTPRHTVKRTYVVDTLYVDLIERYAQVEGVELRDVVNLAFHEFFEQRDYLPGEVKR